MARSKSSGRWLDEHFKDEFVKLAQAQGYRSRSVYKLKEVDQRDFLFKPGFRVLDLGAAPGGWSQYASQKIGKHGKIIASDILTMEEVSGVTFVQGDFTENNVILELKAQLQGKKVDLVLSDMAPNSTGMTVIDQPRAMYLAELAAETAQQHLVKGGSFFVKVFHGSGYESFYKDVSKLFQKVVARKPKASRPRSKEVYILARNFK